MKKKRRIQTTASKSSNLFTQGSDDSTAAPASNVISTHTAKGGRGLGEGREGRSKVGRIAQRRAGLTVARLHALGVSILLCVPGDGAHVGHGVALCVRVGGVRGVASHVGRSRVVLWTEKECTVSD